MFYAGNLRRPSDAADAHKWVQEITNVGYCDKDYISKSLECNCESRDFELVKSLRKGPGERDIENEGDNATRNQPDVVTQAMRSPPAPGIPGGVEHRHRGLPVEMSGPTALIRAWHPIFHACAPAIVMRAARRPA
jgi:hypothetical protein